jgi:hypothetical protein
MSSSTLRVLGWRRTAEPPLLRRDLYLTAREGADGFDAMVERLVELVRR